MSPQECYKTLEISSMAGAEEIHASYRRLAKLYHPDRNPDSPAARARFERVVTAYTTLQQLHRAQSAQQHFGPCDQCGTWADLFESLNGLQCCCQCLLITGKHRFLPEPVITTVRCALPILLEGLAVYCMIMGAVADSNAYLLSGLALTFLALTILFGLTMVLRRIE